MKARKLAKRLNGARPQAVTAAPRKAVSMGPTPERLAKAAEVEVAADGVLRGRVRVKPVLERLRDRKVITQEMFRAGEVYELHWRAGGQAERYAALRMDGTFGGSGEHISDQAIRHRQEYTRAVRALGITLSKVVEDVCCRDVEVAEVASTKWNNEPQARAAGTALLCVGLEKLADLWGIS